MERPSFRKILRCAAPGLLLALLALLPFLNKAFTIDDTLFLKQAQQVLVDPLHPTAFNYVWFYRVERMSALMPSGPVMAYLLVPSVLAGGSEPLAHAVQLLLLLAGIGATVSLALRLDFSAREATIAGLLIPTMPAVLGMAATAMPDVPSMSLGVLALDRLVAWKQDRRWQQAVAATLFFALAPLARTHLFLLLFVGVLFLLEGNNPFLLAAWTSKPRIRWLPLLLAPIGTWALIQITHDPGGAKTGLVSSTFAFSSWGDLANNLTAWATHLTFVLPLGLAWFLFRAKNLLKTPALWLSLPASLFLLHKIAAQGRLWWLLPAMTLGLGAVIDVLWNAFRKRDTVEIALGLWLLIALPIVFYLHLPSKYLLASAPAIALILARLSSEQPAWLRTGTLALSIGAGLLLGLAIVTADAEFAGLARRASEELIAPQIAAGQKVWFTAHWGFQWYAEKAGARCLVNAPPFPRSGDFVISSAETFAGEAPGYLPLVHLATIEDKEPGGRIMSRKMGAGFYSNGWGYFPWLYGTEPLDRIDLWRLR